MLTVRPATVIDAVRFAPEFAATFTRTVPVPVPPAELRLNQLVPDEAVQLHVEAVVTSITTSEAVDAMLSTVSGAT